MRSHSAALLLALAIVVVFATVWLAPPGAAAQPTPASGGPVFVAEIKGIINPVMVGYVNRVLDEAEQSHAAAVVFTLDTPGGLSDSTRDINSRILRATVPVIVYVAPDGARAGSAGVYITYAAHLAAMAPATNIGSATPIAVGEGGEQQLSPEMQAKVTNDAVASIRALAEQRGRNSDFAERAVRDGANLQASHALEANVVNYVASDVSDVLRQSEGASVRLATGDVTVRASDAPLHDARMSNLEQFLLIVTNPTIAYLLLSLGSLGLILELYNPGSIFPGVVGGIGVLLAFYALGTLPVNYAGLALLAFGLLLAALEPFVASHGILGGGGAVAFLLGSLLLINVPNSAPYLAVSPLAIGSTTAVLALFSILALGAIVQGRRRKVVTGREGLIGATAIVRQPVAATEPGTVLLHGEIWRAVATSGSLPAGDAATVEGIDGLVLRVRSTVERSNTP